MELGTVIKQALADRRRERCAQLTGQGAVGRARPSEWADDCGGRLQWPVLGDRRLLLLSVTLGVFLGPSRPRITALKYTERTSFGLKNRPVATASAMG